MMDSLNQFHFLRPYWLLLIIPSLVLGVLLWRQRHNQAGWTRVVAPELLTHLISSDSSGRRRNALPLLVASWCIAAFAAAGPSWQQLPQPVLQKQDALVIILDLSYSMLAADLQPSRQDRVRRKMLDLLRERREGLTALIAYAGDAHIVAPLTDDNPTIANLLPALTPQMMPLPGANTIDAVERALALLDSAGVRQGRLLLVTDGIGESELETLVKMLAGQPRQLALLGVGTEVGAPIPLPDGGFLKDQNGEIIVPALNERPLRELAQRSNGLYRRISVDDSDLAGLLSSELSMLDDESTIALDRQADQWEDMAHWFVLPLLLACLVSFRRGWIYCLPLLLTLAPVEKTQAFEWQELWQTRDQQAQQALAAGDAEKASELFEHPGWRGTAAYQNQDFDTAVESFAAGDSADDWYNRGNALASAGRFDESIDAYKQALERDPAAEDIRKNLDIVERLKEQQEQQQNDSEQQNEQGEQQDQSQEGNKGQQNGESSQDDQQSNEQQSPDEQTPDENSQRGSTQQQSGQQDQDEETGSQGDSEQAEKPNARPLPSPSIDNSAMQEDMEKDQAMQQWLRRVPDDPSGLLREKFRYESRQRQQEGKRRDVTKIW